MLSGQNSFLYYALSLDKVFLWKKACNDSHISDHFFFLHKLMIQTMKKSWIKHWYAKHFFRWYCNNDVKDDDAGGDGDILLSWFILEMSIATSRVSCQEGFLKDNCF